MQEAKERETQVRATNKVKKKEKLFYDKTESKNIHF